MLTEHLDRDRHDRPLAWREVRLAGGSDGWGTVAWTSRTAGPVAGLGSDGCAGQRRIGPAVPIRD
jgi:hypothetical protein